MNPQLITMIERFLAGSASGDDLNLLLSDLDIWNAWQDDDAAIVALRDIVGELQLLLTDIAEGFGDERALRDAATRLVDLGRASVKTAS